VQERTAHVEKLGNERNAGGEGKTNEEGRIIRALVVRFRDTFVNAGENRQDDKLLVLRLFVGFPVLDCQTKKASSMNIMYKTKQMKDIQRLLQWSVTETIRVVNVSHPPEQPEFLLTSSSPSPSPSSSSSPSKLT
jgi:hypothetical protein